MMAESGVARVSALSNDECISNIPGRVSTGCLDLDRLLRGMGEPDDWRGVPLSRVTEIYGPPFIGKSTILDQIFGAVQKAGGVAVLADTERSRDRHYTGKHCDIEALHYLEYEPHETYVENVLADLERTALWYRENFPDVPVVMGWDALGSTATRDEMDKGISGVASEGATKKIKTHKPGAAAKAMALAQRIVAPKLAGTKIGWVFLNHEYDNIEMRGGFGPKRKAYGGNAPKHMASLRIQLYSNGTAIKRSDGWVMGREVEAKLTKSRHGNAMMTAVVPMVSGTGAENLYTVWRYFSRRGVMTQSGSWYCLNLDGELIKFQGWSGLRAKCLEVPDLEERLYSLYRIATTEEGG